MAGTTGLLALFVALTAIFFLNSLRDSEPFIPYINTNITLNNQEDQVRALLPSISNHYLNVTLLKLTAGTTNFMYKITSNDSPNATVLLVRIFGEGANLLCNRTHEVEMIKLFYKQKLGAQVLATFNNGYVLEYLEGKTLQPSSIRDPYFYIPIAQKLGQLHRYKQPASEVTNQGHRGIFNHIEHWMAACLQVLPQNDVTTRHHLQHVVGPAVADLEKNLEKLYGSQPLVFSHNDLNYANVIYNVNEKGEAVISLVDLEYAGFNFRGFDLGNHFCEMAGQGEIDWNNYPSHDTMRKFLRAYLESNKEGVVSQQEVDSLVIEAERWAQVSHIAWHVWALAMAQAENKVTTDFDYSKYSYNRWDEYVRRTQALKDIL